MTEKVVSHVERLEPEVILERVDDVEKADRISRRTFGLDDTAGRGGELTLAMLGGQALIQVNPQKSA